ncbi:carbohydrate kinase family protein [Cupriavidus plantarum]|uniref:Adenosine kinase n=1 Tax=Cupriavidus plantarum TaxID=942865 RepID=A0A316EXR6_9BURK|nr:carbohydrate kinase family protein [Cupriavidus plantarum]NYH99014.1 adenosine kinase [Cupriavidus plantarum]PWK36238.1 adenosine kinase [Cupriavidus plantarum]REF03009.1 adenosine kinase [Cupriavidus plantarum]RLK44126.1 adenosine kinase [Cupriavidus plantarum]CAG2141575.1 Adenosine kinase [Cupriavidus plantarum]
MASLICGSVAYDTIMTFDGRFREHILPDQIHMLNVSFLVPGMRREFGGCAGNIAYTLKMLGGDPIVMGTVGQDAGPYLQYLRDLGIGTDFIRTLPELFTAQAMITTDLDNNQITAFHPGAMSESQQTHVNDALAAGKRPAIGIVAPDSREGMLHHARQFAEADIPFIFDLGQAMPLFNGEDLRQFIELASYVTVNDYEAQVLLSRTAWTSAEVAAKVRAFIVTHGERGASVFADGKQIAIPAVPAERVVDPTGCGDAFRGGLLYGIENGLDWETTGRLASLMGALKIAQQGPQNHWLSREEIGNRFQSAFGYRYG